MAAVDYARLRQRLPRARLLFIAHREEILDQRAATFRYALRDASFREKWVGRSRPQRFEHVIASIQSLNASGLTDLPADPLNTLILNDIHHPTAPPTRSAIDPPPPPH